MEKGVSEMKKFLVSLILGVTMMAIGATMLLFEVREYQVVDDLSALSDTQQVTYSAKDIDGIIFKDYPEYTWECDDSLGDEIKIFYTSAEIERDGDYLRIDSDDHRAFAGFNKFLDGIKHKKMFTNEALNQVKIISSSKVYDTIEIMYE